MNELLPVFGLIAPVLFVSAYALVSTGKWSSMSLKFHLFNFAGGALILLSLLAQWNLSIFILEICWCSISAFGIWKALRT